MKVADVELIIQRNRKKFPEASPRSDHLGQRAAVCGQGLQGVLPTGGDDAHVSTSPLFYPQSNGKLERWHHSLKSEAVGIHSLSDRDQAERIIAEYVRYYNEERLNSAIDYIAPVDKLAGREKLIFAEMNRKLEEDRRCRAQARQSAVCVVQSKKFEAGDVLRVS